MFFLLLSYIFSKKYNACNTVECDKEANVTYGIKRGDRIKIIFKIFNETASKPKNETKTNAQTTSQNDWKPNLLELLEEESTISTDSTEETTVSTDSTEGSTISTDSTEETTISTDATEESTISTDATEESTMTTDATDTGDNPGDNPNENEDENSNPVQYYIRFYPVVDKLAVLEIPDPDCEIRDMINSNILVQLPDDIAPIRHKIRRDIYTVEYLNLLIYLNKGNVTKVYWDNTFDVNSCRDRNIVDDDTCYIKNEMNGKCAGKSIKVFVGFLGTDKDNVPLTSAEYMPSSFLKFGAGGIIDDISDFAKDVTNWFK